MREDLKTVGNEFAVFFISDRVRCFAPTLPTHVARAADRVHAAS